MRKIIAIMIAAAFLMMSCYSYKSKILTAKEYKKQGYIVWGKEHWEKHPVDSIFEFTNIFELIPFDQINGFESRIDTMVQYMISRYEQSTGIILPYNKFRIEEHYLSAVIDWEYSFSEQARFYYATVWNHYRIFRKNLNSYTDEIKKTHYWFFVPLYENRGTVYAYQEDEYNNRIIEFTTDYRNINWDNAFYDEKPKIRLARLYSNTAFTNKEYYSILVEEE